MGFFSDALLLARLQFAITTLLHIIWPVFTIGLSLFIVALEAAWLKTGDLAWYRHARFWTRLFLVNFGVGVVTGLPLEFQFGTNWAPFSSASGDFIGNILGFEGAMAFMLEAGFLGIMVFGWNRVAPAIHLFATSMVAAGASLSAFWIMTASAWMHTPAGGNFVDGKFVVESYHDAIFNPNMPWAVSHMWVACLETSLFVIGGISAWYILRGVHKAFFLRTLRLALYLAIVVAPLQVLLGDGSGLNVFHHQPAKGAAIEGHWETNPPGEGAAWSLLAWPDKARQANRWSVEIPYVLSLMVTHSPEGRVPGLKEFTPDEQPPLLPLLYYSFRVMVAIGFWFVALMLWSLWALHRGDFTVDRIGGRRGLLTAWLWSIPLGYLAVACGWIVREVGRQPWVIHGVMRTAEGASQLPAATVGVSLVAYTTAYLLVLVAFVVFARRILYQGPDLTLVPEPPAMPSLGLRRGSHTDTTGDS